MRSDFLPGENGPRVWAKKEAMEKVVKRKV
jgi:hypothetical protein